MSTPESSKAIPNSRRNSLAWKNINVWGIKGPILVLALVFGFISRALGWSRAPFVAALAIAIPMIGFRDLWTKGRFWITVAGLAVVQVLLVIEMGAVVGQQGFPLMLICGLLDCAFVISAIYWICAKANGNRR